MYKELLKANVVIADLSTANANAFSELGVRHTLRPHTTIVISEDRLAYPFDLNHIKIIAVRNSILDSCYPEDCCLCWP